MKTLRYILGFFIFLVLFFHHGVTAFAPRTQKGHLPQTDAEHGYVVNIEEMLAKSNPNDEKFEQGKITEKEAIARLLRYLYNERADYLSPDFYDTGRYHGYEFVCLWDNSTVHAIELNELIKDDSFFIFEHYKKYYDKSGKLTHSSLQSAYAVNRTTNEIVQERKKDHRGSWQYNDEYRKVYAEIEFMDDPSKLTKEEAVRLIVDDVYYGNADFSSGNITDGVYYYNYEISLPWDNNPNIIQRIEYYGSLQDEQYFIFEFYTWVYIERDGKIYLSGKIYNNSFAVNRETKEIIKRRSETANGEWIYNDKYEQLWINHARRPKSHKLNEEEAVELLFENLCGTEADPPLMTFYDNGDSHGYEFILPWDNAAVKRLECDESWDDSLSYIFRLYDGSSSTYITSFAVNRRTRTIFQQRAKSNNESASVSAKLTEKEAIEFLFESFYGDDADGIWIYFYDTGEYSGCNFILPWGEGNVNSLQLLTNVKNDLFFAFEFWYELYDSEENLTRIPYSGSYAVNRVTKEVIPERTEGENGEWIYSEAYRQIWQQP